MDDKTGLEMPEQADLEQILFSLEWVENGEVQVYGEHWDMEESEDEDFTPEKTPWVAGGRTSGGRCSSCAVIPGWMERRSFPSSGWWNFSTVTRSPQPVGTIGARCSLNG